MKQTLIELFKREKPFFLVIPAFFWQVFFFYVPLLLILLMSFLYYDLASGLRFTLSHYIPFINWTYSYIIFKSAILAAVNVIFCFLLGYPLAYFLAFKTQRFKIVFLFLVTLPFWTNLLLHIYAWFFIFDRVGIINKFLQWTTIIQEPIHLLNTHFSILVVMLYCYLPFMVMPIYTTLENFDKTLIEASKDLGASRFETWYHIVYPLSMSGVISGAFLVFVPSFGEFAIPSLIGGDKFIFVGSVIAQFALSDNTAHYGTAFTVMSFCTLALFVLLGAIFKRLFLRYMHLTGIK